MIRHLKTVSIYGALIALALVLGADQAHGVSTSLLIGVGGLIRGSRVIDAPDYPAARQTGAVSKSKALPKESLLESLYVRFTGTVDVVGGTATGSIYADATYRFLGRVAFNTSKRKLWDVSIAAVALLNKFWANGRSIQDPISNDTAALSEVVEANITLPFAMPFSYSPAMTLLPLYALDNPSITLLIDAPDSMVSGGDYTNIGITGGVITLVERPVENVNKHPANQFGLLLMNDSEYAFAGSETQHKFYLENIEPGEEIRAILVEAFDTGTAGGLDYEYSDSIVDDLLVNVNGEEVFKSTKWTHQQDRNVETYGFTAREVGAVLIDAAEDKNTGPGDLWQVRGGSKPYIQMKLTFGTTSSKVRITTVSVLRGRRAAARRN